MTVYMNFNAHELQQLLNDARIIFNSRYCHNHIFKYLNFMLLT